MQRIEFCTDNNTVEVIDFDGVVLPCKKVYTSYRKYIFNE